MELLNENQRWEIYEGDCIPRMGAIDDAAFDFSIFSPPFPLLYAYSSEACDIGNSEDLRGEAKIHLSYFYKQLRRVVKPGRVIVVHVAQIPRMKRAGGVGIFDFRGMNIRLGERAGLVFEYDWMVRKNPQSQAIRTRSRELQFSGLEKDRAKSRGALPDYLLKFRVPGDNERAIDSPEDVTRNDWINWAEPGWQDIRETDTLNTAEGKSESDTRHICPLQLGVISRLIRLYTNPGEIVFTPFAGIGSEIHEAVRLGRRAYGCEIKPEYIAAARKNAAKAEKMLEESEQLPLFGVGSDEANPPAIVTAALPNIGPGDAAYWEDSASTSLDDI